MGLSWRQRMTTHPFGASSRMLLANLTVGNIVNSGKFLRPPSPQFWGGISSKSPRIGGFRGPSAIITMLRNNSPAASSQEEILAAKGLAESAPYLPIKGLVAGLSFQSRPKQTSLKGISSQGIEVLTAPPKYATETN